ncbi:TPA: hypothetical protein DCZ32_00200 [Candidatus Uhrbacteria bacterium]|nr:hypothetical protein [Candidatus Uhrbacteria bacterium]
MKTKGQNAALGQRSGAELFIQLLLIRKVHFIICLHCIDFALFWECDTAESMRLERSVPPCLWRGGTGKSLSSRSAVWTWQQIALPK